MDIIKLIFGDPKGVSAKPTASAAGTSKDTTTPMKPKKMSATKKASKTTKKATKKKTRGRPKKK